MLKINSKREFVQSYIEVKRFDQFVGVKVDLMKDVCTLLPKKCQSEEILLKLQFQPNAH